MATPRHANWLFLSGSFLVVTLGPAASLAQTVGPGPMSLDPDPSGVSKVRFISFAVPPESTSPTAIRIQLIELHHTNYPCDVCIFPFVAFEGMHVWVGPPNEYAESDASAETFQSSIAQCTPYYHDWSTGGLLNVTGVTIVPGSMYRVEQVAITCQGREDDPDCQPGGVNVSSQLEIKTTYRWADVEEPYSTAPFDFSHPNFGDVSALVDRFRHVPGALPKVRALLVGDDAFGTLDVAEQFGFQHISACLDAFRGQAYPHRPGQCAGSHAPGYSGMCRGNSDCQQGNGEPPCTLYCP